MGSNQMQLKGVPEITSLVSLLLFLCSCDHKSSSHDAGNAKSCNLSPGKYIVQQASYDSTVELYSLNILGAPSCFKQPFKSNNLRLARLDEQNKENAVLDTNEQGSPVLSMQPQFSIAVTQPTTNESGYTVQQKSSWTPFLAGVGGALAGAMISRAIFNQPKHYMPPPARAGQSSMSGWGASSSTREGAVRTYQKKYKNSPVSRSLSQKKTSFFKRKANKYKQPRRTRFFKSRSSSRGGRSFFRGGGRRR